MPTDVWDKLRAISTIVAATLIPLAIAVIGHSYTTSVKEKERETQFVEIAVKILSGTPSSDNKTTREWAIRVIDRYSEVKFTGEEKSNLVEHVKLASGSLIFQCGNHNPPHIGSSFAEAKVFTTTHGCANWAIKTPP